MKKGALKRLGEDRQMICINCSQIIKRNIVSVPDWFGRSCYHHYNICNSCGYWHLEFIDKPKPFSESKQNFARKTTNSFVRILKYINYSLTKINFHIIQNKYLYTKKLGSLLDIGCGRGYFLSIAEKRGWNVCGIEPQSDKYEEAKRLSSFTIIDKPIEDIDFKNQKYDVIFLWHVLEHLENIYSVLNIFNDIMNKPGTILIAVPNIDSFQAKIFGIHWFHLSAPVHYHQFGKRSLKVLMINHGYKVKKIGSFDIISNISGWFFSFFNILGLPENYLWHRMQKSSKKPQKLLEYQLLLLGLIPFIALISFLAALIEIIGKSGGCIIATFNK